MQRKVEELKARKGSLVAKAERAKAGVEDATATSGQVGGTAFAEFRRMEDQIEGVETAFAAQREVEEALGPARGPGGMTADEVEARFRMLEYGGQAERPGAGSEVDEELQALKKKVRIGI